MKIESFDSVWDAISDTPAEAENMKVRSALMQLIERYIKDRGLSQTDAAKVFGVTQPRISDLLRGKIDLFGIDGLINMLSAIGVSIRFDIDVAASAVAIPKPRTSEEMAVA